HGHHEDVRGAHEHHQVRRRLVSRAHLPVVQAPLPPRPLGGVGGPEAARDRPPLHAVPPGDQREADARPGAGDRGAVRLRGDRDALFQEVDRDHWNPTMVRPGSHSCWAADFWPRIRSTATIAPASVGSRRPSWIAWRQAATRTSLICAIEKPSVAATRSSSNAAPRPSWRYRRRSTGPGFPKWKIRSNRLGRSVREASSFSGWFVVARISTPSSGWMPSIRLRKWLSPSASLKSESTSSKQRIEGASSAARSNAWLSSLRSLHVVSV